jgi:hypothetical protein
MAAPSSDSSIASRRPTLAPSIELRSSRPVMPKKCAS